MSTTKGAPRLTLLLLPGMDGTGALFDDFVKLLPGWIEPVVVGYPRDRQLSYDQLSPIVESVVPSDVPFVILAESFSTPLAVRLAAKAPERLQALVLCAGFVSPPRRGLLSYFARVFAPLLFTFGLPESVCRQFLVGNSASQALVDAVRTTVSGVSNGVLAHRLRSVLSCKAECELRSVSVPLLYVAGVEDRLVTESSFHEIKHGKPDALIASINAPHLLLQAKPREAIDALVPFLSQVGVHPEQEIAEE
ncbi:MAG: alpha/beta hydrolase [Acidobacteria bacterium]|nr:alpha/beta hydrolase [Acidobacteriota bacterium]